MLNFLENHDEQRFASDQFAGDADKVLPALVVSSMMNTGPMMIYFGQELGERAEDAEGFSGKDGRSTIGACPRLESGTIAGVARCLNCRQSRKNYEICIKRFLISVVWSRLLFMAISLI